MSPQSNTAKRVPVWSAMLVSVPDQMAAHCEEMLAPLVIVRVADIEQALDRLPRLRPLVTATLQDVDRDVDTAAARAALRERAKDVGSQFVVIPQGCDPIDLGVLLRRALADAEAKLD